MFKLDSTKKPYPLFTMLIGLISFSISDIIINYLSNYIGGNMSINNSNAIVLLIITGAMGGLIMLFMLRIFRRILVKVIWITIGIFISFIIGFEVTEASGLLLTYLVPKLVIPDMVGEITLTIIMNIIFGSIMAIIIYGKKSIWFFAVLCGIVSIPFGLLLYPDAVWAGLNWNTLVIMSSFGTTTGLSIGLYKLLELRNED